MKFREDIQDFIMYSLIIVCFFGCIFKCTQKDERTNIEEIKSNTEISIKNIQAKQDSLNLEKIKIQTKQLK